jgi:GNAT superfamily N-acetyltransferase
MKHILLNANDKNIELVEKLRYETYNQEIPVNILDTFYAQKLKEKNLLLFVTILGTEICAVCYVSRVGYSLFIDQLFVKKEYQNTGLRIGRSLLEYINTNKKLVEQELSFKPLRTSKLIYTTEKSHELYLKIGYKDDNNFLNTMKKRI